MSILISNLATTSSVDSDSNSLILQTDNGTKQITFADFVDAIAGSDAGRRNGFYGGRDLTDVYTVDELQEKVAASDFTGLMVGDYITVSITTSLGGTEDVDLLFGGFNYFMENGSSSYTVVSDPHIIMFPKDCFATTSVMNSSSTTEGGYVGSYMYTDTLPVYASALSSALNGHMLTHSRYLTTTVSTSASSAAGLGLTGSSSACTWSDETLCLMSEPMVYGCAAFSSSGRDVSDACMQIPLFALRPDLKIAHLGHGSSSRNFWWLSAVASSAYFAYCGSDGHATCGSASYSNGVRPYFLFG